MKELESETVLLPTHNRTARPVTVKGWHSRRGRFFMGDNAERLARWDGSTHASCEREGCENIQPKMYTACGACRAVDAREKFEAMPSRPYVRSVFPVYLYDGDEYFFDYDRLIEYLIEHEINPRELMLMHCKPAPFSEIQYEYYSDDVHESVTLPDTLYEKIDELNALAKSIGTSLFIPSDIAVELSEEDIKQMLADIVEATEVEGVEGTENRRMKDSVLPKLFELPKAEMAELVKQLVHKNVLFAEHESVNDGFITIVFQDDQELDEWMNHFEVGTTSKKLLNEYFIPES